MPDSTTTVSDLRQRLAAFVSERDWGQFHSPKNLSMALAAEAAELMEHFLWVEGPESRAQLLDPARREEVCDEIADVAGVVFALCNALELDLSDIFLRKMAKNERKYPADKSRGRWEVPTE